MQDIIATRQCAEMNTIGVEVRPSSNERSDGDQAGVVDVQSSGQGPNEGRQYGQIPGWPHTDGWGSHVVGRTGVGGDSIPESICSFLSFDSMKRKVNQINQINQITK